MATVTKDMALKELARRELISRGELSSGETKPNQPTDPLTEYKTGNVGDWFNNIFVRPGAGVRSAIQGGSFMGGFNDPNSTPTFQQLALEKFAPKTDSVLTNYIGGTVPSAVGLAADIATNPADLLLALVGKAPVKGTGTTLESLIADSKAGQTLGRMANAEINKPSDLAKLVNPRLTETPGALERLQAAKAGKEARTTVSKLLPSADLTTDIKQNRPSGVQTEGASLIKKTSNPMDVFNKFRNEKNAVISEVDKLVQANIQPIEADFIGTRAKMILQKDLNNATPKEKADILKWVKEEGRWIDSQGGFDTVKANARKRYLYQETQGIQKKQASGKVTVTSPERDKVRDAFSQAYKEAIEKTHPDIQKLNARFAGLDAGETASAKLAESSIEKPDSNIWQRAIAYIGGRTSPGQSAAAAVREVPYVLQGDKNSITSLTGKIEKYSGLAGDLLSKSRELQGESLLRSFMRKKPNSQYLREVLTADDIKALTSGYK